MKHRITRIPWNSIGFKLVIGVYSILLPLIGLLIYNNFYSIKVIHNQVAESYQNMISLYTQQIDVGLEDASNYLYKLSVLDNDLIILLNTNNEDQYNLAKASLSTKMNQDILMYKTIDLFFIYSSKRNEHIEAFNTNTDYNTREKVREYIKAAMNSGDNTRQLLTKGWHVKQIDKKYYLLQILRTGDTYIGAWVKAQDLLIPLGLINLGNEGTALLATNKGITMVSSNNIKYNGVDLKHDFSQYYLTGNNKQFLAVGKTSAQGDFSLIALIPNSKILEKLPVLQTIIKIIEIGSLILLPLCFLILRRIILNPLKRILNAMKRIREGDIDVRIEANSTSEEFKIVNETFNNMIGEIHDLRIDVYEEQLSKQKSELQHLQLQVKPHFFLNSLNIIYSLAQTENYKLIQEMTLCLVNYFRYMFKSNLSLVTLRSELEHVRNYMRIQELRYPNSLNCHIEAPELLLDTNVPQLVIQTFLENTVKYAVTLDGPIEVYINITHIIIQEVNGIKIIIRDTGKGFTEEKLAEINKGDRIIDNEGEHIGIWNVQRRLNLLYTKGASISFSNGNNPVGAIVEIILPIQN